MILKHSYPYASTTYSSCAAVSDEAERWEVGP